MTKKDYVKIAQVIKTANDNVKAKTLSNPILYITEHLADVLHTDNERFNYRRFYVACGVTE